MAFINRSGTGELSSNSLELFVNFMTFIDLPVRVKVQGDIIVINHYSAWYVYLNLTWKMHVQYYIIYMLIVSKI